MSQVAPAIVYHRGHGLTTENITSNAERDALRFAWDENAICPTGTVGVKGKVMKGNYKANRMDNGEIVEGNLICKAGSPFAYILTPDNFDKMTVNELNDGETKCTLIRVLAKSVEQIN